MPVMVTIQANGDHLRTVHISRMAPSGRTAGRYRYSAVVRPEGEAMAEQDWDAGIMFEHCIDDGVEMLVSRALLAVVQS